MEKTKKESLKKTNPKKYYSRVNAAFVFGEYAALLAPLGIVFGVKWNEYFSVTDGNNVRMSIGCVLSLIVAVVMVYKEIKHTEKVEKQATKLSLVAGLAVAFTLSFLMQVILTDLTLILGVELAGACASYALEFGSAAARKKRDAYATEELRINAEEAYRSKAVKERKARPTE